SFDLACIAGHNGAGKSSILDAMTWALFGRARKHDESVINIQSDLAEVTFVFQYEGNVYRVIRANPRGGTKLVEFHIQQDHPDAIAPIWKPLSERTMRATDARIIETLRLDYETFTNAAFFLQGEADQFTQQNPNDRKRILAQILGLGVWETYRKRTYKRRKGIETEIDKLDGRLSEIIKELGEEGERKNHLQELEEDLERAIKARQTQEENLDHIRAIEASLKERRKYVETLTRQVEKSESVRQQLEERLAARETEKAEFAQTLEREDEIRATHAEWEKAQRELEEWDAIAEEFREQEKQRQAPLTEIASEGARLEQELTSLREQQEKLQNALDEVPVLEEKLAEAEEAISEAKKALADRDEKKAELEQARQKLAEAQAENPRLKAAMEELKERIDKLEVTEGADCPLCGQALAPDERASLIERLNKEGTEMGDLYRANQALLAEADELVKGLKLEITELGLAEDALRDQTREADKVFGKLEQVKARKEEWDAEPAGQLEEVGRAIGEKTFAPRARAKLAEIDAKLKEIGYDAAQHDQLRDAVSAGEIIQEEVSALEKAGAAIKPLEREVAELGAELTERQKELEQQQTEKEEVSQALAQDEVDVPNAREAQRELLTLKEHENILQREVGAAQQKVKILATQKERRHELEGQREELAYKVGQFKQLERAFSKRGVPALLIEQALPQIEARANQVLDRLSGGTMSVRFLTQREYKDKKRDDLKETLDIQIRDQAGMRDYEMYSGGEAFRINFAIRLALSHVLAQRAGARLQTLVIDEGFGSQDAIGRQRLIEAINLI
ncbi:MAG: SMC family ATPase, partial [Chloroflexota bacterium]|nr:SMC family ATPase [Chloroflexota bacterium]